MERRETSVVNRCTYSKDFWSQLKVWLSRSINVVNSPWPVHSEMCSLRLFVWISGSQSPRIAEAAKGNFAFTLASGGRQTERLGEAQAPCSKAACFQHHGYRTQIHSLNLLRTIHGPGKGNFPRSA